MNNSSIYSLSQDLNGFLWIVSDNGKEFKHFNNKHKNWTIPSLLIQPFVENAIKHGMTGLKIEKEIFWCHLNKRELLLLSSLRTMEWEQAPDNGKKRILSE